MNIRKIVGFSVVVAGFGLVASCSEDDDEGSMMMDGGGGMGMSSAGSSAMASNAGMGGMGMGNQIPGILGMNNRPALTGARMDRVGRVAITAALVGAFNPPQATAIRDAYNEGNLLNPDNLEGIKDSLGILDGLDLNCGNQLAADNAPERYAFLAGVLNDDQLYVDSSRGDCQLESYLGVEAEALGALPEGGGSCGGRLPGDDVIERSYSVLAAGLFDGVDDGIPSDDATHSPDNFPFIAPPIAR